MTKEDRNVRTLIVHKFIHITECRIAHYFMLMLCGNRKTIRCRFSATL